MYPIRLTRQLKSREEVVNRDRVGWVEYFGPQLDLQMLGPFRNAWSDSVIKMRRLIYQAVCSVVERLLQVVVYMAFYRKLFVVIVSGFFVEAICRIDTRARVLCYRELEMVLTSRLLICPGLRSEARVLLLLCRLRRGWVLPLPRWAFKSCLDDFLRGIFYS